MINTLLLEKCINNQIGRVSNLQSQGKSSEVIKKVSEVLDDLTTAWAHVMLALDMPNMPKEDAPEGSNQQSPQLPPWVG